MTKNELTKSIDAYLNKYAQNIERCIAENRESNAEYGEEERIAESAKVDPSAKVHPTAVVADNVLIGPGVVIGKGAYVGPYTRIKSNAKIGDYTSINGYCIVGMCAEVGNECTVSDDSEIGAYAKIGDKTVLSLGNRVGDRTEIGKSVYLRAGVEIYNDVLVGDRVFFERCAVVFPRSKISKKSVICATEVGPESTIVSSFLEDGVTIKDGVTVKNSYVEYNEKEEVIRKNIINNCISEKARN